MSRELPSDVKQDIVDPFSSGAWFHLVEIVIPGQTTQRIARNTEDVVYSGDTFSAGNFEVSDIEFKSDGSFPRIVVTIPHDRVKTMESILNATYGGDAGSVKVIKAGEDFLDVAIPALEFDYDILSSHSDDKTVSIIVGLPNPLTKKVPQRVYDNNRCPFATPTCFKGPECGYAGADSSCTGTYGDCYTKGNTARWGGDLVLLRTG